MFLSLKLTKNPRRQRGRERKRAKGGGVEKREEQACNLNLIYISVENQPSLDTNSLETTTNPLHLLKHIHTHKHISSAVTIPLIQGLGHQSMTACHAQQTHKTHAHTR